MGWCSPVDNLIACVCTRPSSTRLAAALCLSSRVHPGESCASWIMEGVVRFIVGDHPSARWLRQHLDIYVRSMLNIVVFVARVSVRDRGHIGHGCVALSAAAKGCMTLYLHCATIYLSMTLSCHGAAYGSTNTLHMCCRILIVPSASCLIRLSPCSTRTASSTAITAQDWRAATSTDAGTLQIPFFTPRYTRSSNS